MMNEMIFLLIVIAAVIVVLVVLKAKSQGSDADEIWPFYAKKLLSQPEQILYFRLVQALPEHIVLAQVQLSRLLGVKKGNNYRAWFNRINRMSVDFVVCNKDSSIVAVIELDDATHQKEDRRTADAKKDKALTSAGIRIVRWHAKSIPDIATIQSTILPTTAAKREAPQTAHRLP
jgi:very-short-patch-repair endonuclease